MIECSAPSGAHTGATKTARRPATVHPLYSLVYTQDQVGYSCHRLRDRFVRGSSNPRRKESRVVSGFFWFREEFMTGFARLL